MKTDMINHKSYKTKWSLFPRGIVLLYSLWIHGSVRSCFWIKSILSVTFFSEWHCVYILSSSVKRWTRSTESQIECHQTERYLDQNIGLNKIMIQWRHQYFINSSYTDKFNIFSSIIKFIFFLNFFFFLNMKNWWFSENQVELVQPPSQFGMVKLSIHHRRDTLHIMIMHAKDLVSLTRVHTLHPLLDDIYIEFLYVFLGKFSLVYLQILTRL